MSSSLVNNLGSQFLNKNRRLTSILSGSAPPSEPAIKRVKTESNSYETFDAINRDSNTIQYDFLNENEAPQFSENESIIDFEGIDLEEYDDNANGEIFSIDDLNENADITPILQSMVYKQAQKYEQKLLYQNKPKVKNKRKQGIVGRPTLSSPLGYLYDDNVYSTGNCVRNNFDYQNPVYQNQLQPQINQTRFVNKISTQKRAAYRLHDFGEFDEQKINPANRSRPRILSKPKLNDGKIKYSHYNSNFDQSGKQAQWSAEEMNKQMYLNKQFARNLINRARRQGFKVDISKLPKGLIDQGPNEQHLNSLHMQENINASQAIEDELLRDGGVAEIKRSEPQNFNDVLLKSTSKKAISAGNPTVIHPCTSVAAARPRSLTSTQNPISEHNNLSLNPRQSPPATTLSAIISPKPSQQTASTLLMRKWKNQKL